MSLEHFAIATPHKPAIIWPDRNVAISWQEFNAKANQIAHLLRRLGLQAGDTAAVFMENRADNPLLFWGAYTAGLYIVPIGFHLKSDEVRYILEDSGASALFVSPAQREVTEPVADIFPELHRFCVGEKLRGYRLLDDALHGLPTEPIASETRGSPLLYSSGTTGRPKAIRREPLGYGFERPDPVLVGGKEMMQVDERSVFLVVAPFYHTSAMTASMMMLETGATLVVQSKFDAEKSLGAIDRYGVTNIFAVPTMFTRWLRLPPGVRGKYDVSSLKVVMHGGAATPVPIKERMIDWFGPVFVEVYGSTERCGGAFITSQEWLQHKGSVGRPTSAFGRIHILDDEHNEVPPNTIGTIYAEMPKNIKFSYDDPDKDAATASPQGWRTIGDIGYLDDDGYLYLTDRKDFMIISGGINIYPAELERVLGGHPKVADCAIIGLPCEEFGQRVHAVVEPINFDEADAVLADELISYCKQNYSSVKAPKKISFVKSMLRLPSGKVPKRELIEKYRDS